MSILTVYESNFDVNAVDGDAHLGGEDFNNRLVGHFVQKFLTEDNVDLRSNDKAMNRLRKECEKAKRTLSSASKALVYLEHTPDSTLEASILRTQFEELCADLFQRTIK